MPPRSWVHNFRIQGSNEPLNMHPFFAPDAANFDLLKLSTKTLVVPVVSAANVPQLAVDILIASLSLSRLGTFEGTCLVPVVGGREGGQPGVTTPLELFGRDDIDFVVMQQRSPVLKSQKDRFVSSLLNFVKVIGFKSLLFVSGVDSTNRTDSQMHTPIYHLCHKASHSLAGSSLVSLASLPQYISSHSLARGPSMPGGGLTRRILSSIPDDWSPITCFLLWMGMEGDNRGDAALVASVITKVLSASGNIEEWKEPESWQQGLFGTPNDQALFG